MKDLTREDLRDRMCSLKYLKKHLEKWAEIAQLVEQRPEKPCVDGSIPPLGTIFLEGVDNFNGAGTFFILRVK